MLPLRSSTSTGSFSGTLGPASLRRRIHRRWRPIDAVGLALLAVVAICALVALWTRSNMSAAELRTGDAQGLRGKGRMQLRRNARLDLRTLVIYVYSGSDPEYEPNLMYFLREGVKVSSGGQVPTFQPLRQHLQVSISAIVECLSHDHLFPDVKRIVGLLSRSLAEIRQASSAAHLPQQERMQGVCKCYKCLPVIVGTACGAFYDLLEIVHGACFQRPWKAAATCRTAGR